MEWKRPPRTFAELQVWRVYCRTQDFSIWPIVNRWLNKYGNPYEDGEHTTYDMQEERFHYQQALLYIIQHK